LDPTDLVNALHHRFDVEHISKYFKSNEYSFSGATLKISPQNSILIEFASLQAEYPQFYAAKQYRLLLLFSLQNTKTISNDLTLELDNIRRKDNIDRIVLWSCIEHRASTLHSLKAAHIDVISIAERDVAATSSITHYVPIPDKDHNYALALNLAADLVLKRLKKMFHLVLSEVAAPIYDQLYAKQKVATDEMMRFEERLVRDIVQRFLPDKDTRKIAVDVGCGTGRHTIPLAKWFERVYAFDFSPLMIIAAEKKKAAADLKNVLFSVADMEYESIRDEGQFVFEGAGQVDLIVASFGLGSFIEDTAGMIRRFHGWMKDDALLLLSFYNPQTIISEITPNWRDTSLAAHLDVETNTLRVELSPKTVFHIYCKPYSTEIQKLVTESFSLQQITTFPTLMALMPNSLLQSGKAIGLFRFIDETLADHKDYKFGHYVTIVARKEGKHSAGGHQRVLSVLAEIGAKYKLFSHPPVVSTDDVRRHIQMGDGLPVKTLLFRRQDDRKLIVLVLPARLRVNTKALAAKIGVRRLVFGTDRDVLATGFPLGGIAPFAFSPETVEKCYIHAGIGNTDTEWIYTGSGDNTKTLKISKSDFMKLLADYEFFDG
jgi:prolyl-tRNA editing enzyme YbaK/EbsC (Cys-tRNA(Pro) deacylase)/SAM-dependent methyltransferase